MASRTPDRRAAHRHASGRLGALAAAAPLAALLVGASAPPPATPLADTSSHYLTTRDGTRLAADVHLPAGRTTGQRLPALLELTRYWRSSEDPTSFAPNPALSPLDRHFLQNGYAVVKVDVRGSGASFGSRPVEYGDQEVEDGYDVVQWWWSSPGRTARSAPSGPPTPEPPQSCSRRPGTRL